MHARPHSAILFELISAPPPPLATDPKTARTHPPRRNLPRRHPQERPLLQHVRPDILLDDDGRNPRELRKCKSLASDLLGESILLLLVSSVPAHASEKNSCVPGKP